MKKYCLKNFVYSFFYIMQIKSQGSTIVYSLHAISPEEQCQNVVLFLMVYFTIQFRLISHFKGINNWHSGG